MPLLFGTAKFNEQEHLTIGGCDVVRLTEKYGTPLFVYDVAHIRERARGFKQTFNSLGVKNKVIYASKAFCCLAMYKLLEEEELGCDVVSAGEIYTAIKGGMSPENIEFHGNNKTKEELTYAVEHGVGTIIIDNFYEIDLLSAILKETGKQQNVMFRITPGVDAETHEYILTGQVDSKFGFDVTSGQATKALEKILADKQFVLKGVHCHIGSQIFSAEGFLAAVEKMLLILDEWKQTFNYTVDILNIGGGFGVKYTEADDPLEPEAFVKAIVSAVQGQCELLTYPLPEIWIEPGRSIIAEAGTTLYTIGSQKSIPDVRHYVSVDGGMGDNIRPALYDALYDGFLANRISSEATEAVRVVGKYCESGDVLIKNIELPPMNPNDLFAMTSTGAYGYSMANNYNRNLKPAVVFVENGVDKLVIRRETYEDLIALDCE
ncbi:diaminopimelate decarboxylase [Enterococcus caccae]|uniref:Diaminopimelate decarboxylase n=1 Tax=Enterococcus caccae ATCC BAA-1240 TaxID=1158612 RepID=R3W8L2_9ENTE|nr:diaminopimelate decarboxylase [Enterococcus caccae]EOL44186.1 diaminopimelate decarboxylase [Enterococcus caccae ATCC BAA-1240]EOT68698.1 diaminopimelate decarboxylase [Enterococcus caccae ATCC BAA-1240]OJG28086.1 diaminopimelate decarboxylase [Enterococcus caccae]